MRWSRVFPRRCCGTARVSFAATGALVRAPAAEVELREVVADVAEDVLDLAAKEHHRHDDRDRDDRDYECVFHESLAFLVTNELMEIHFYGSSFPSVCPFVEFARRRKFCPNGGTIISGHSVALTGEIRPTAWREASHKARNADAFYRQIPASPARARGARASIRMTLTRPSCSMYASATSCSFSTA